MSRRDDATLLHDMIAAGRLALAGVEGREMDALAADHVRALGLVKCLEIFGEAASRLSTNLRALHPGVPWEQIIGMRHRLVHAYFEIDYEQIWKTLAADLPPLIKELEEMLTSEFGGSP